MNNLNIRKGDTVLVLTGKDKGKKGKVLTANPTNETVTVEGVNIVTKHVKPRGAQKPGGMQKAPGNTHVSNVMLVCPDCGSATRIAHTLTEENGKTKSLRTCKKCGVPVDKAPAAAKKAAKKSAKESVKEGGEVKKKPARKAKTEAGETVAAPAEEPKKAAKAKKPVTPDDKA